VASASVAQVHFAALPDGTDVASRCCARASTGHRARPRADERRRTCWRRCGPKGRRLKPREVVAEFDKYLHDELDLMREAANCSQLRRNFRDSTLLIVPEVYWDWCGPASW
jgi:ubiquinone biosynthesis protein